MQEWQGECVPIKAWVDGVPVESEAITQLKEVASMPFVFKHLAVMPDVHLGIGSCIGSVIPTKGAVIPSAVGVDLGCGMGAFRTSLTVDDVPEERRERIYDEIQRLVPTGRTNQGGKGDRGAWHDIPRRVLNIWRTHLESDLEDLMKRHQGIQGRHGVNHVNHLGTLGSGNHFIEVCLDLENRVWVMLHSGSRGIGNRIGQYFIRLAKETCQNGGAAATKADEELRAYFQSPQFKGLSKQDKKRVSAEKRAQVRDEKRKLGVRLPRPDLAYLEEGTQLFDDYLAAALWAQRYARYNRDLMCEGVTTALQNVCGKFAVDMSVRCHHNYVAKEKHFGEDVWVTRKGAVSAFPGEMAIIPGSMGAKSYIVEGLGCVEAFCSASHGAGRRMSRKAAKKTFTVEDHRKATQGIQCAKDVSVLDETPGAYKDIDTVMEAQQDLVRAVHQLRQIVCIKGCE